MGNFRYVVWEIERYFTDKRQKLNYTFRYSLYGCIYLFGWLVLKPFAIHYSSACFMDLDVLAHTNAKTAQKETNPTTNRQKSAYYINDLRSFPFFLLVIAQLFAVRRCNANFMSWISDLQHSQMNFKPNLMIRIYIFAGLMRICVAMIKISHKPCD